MRVRFIGRRGGRVPKRVLRHIEDTEALTAQNRRMTLTFAFNYGGRAELTDAVRAIAREVAAGRLKADDISEKTIARHLYAPDMPDPDLMVRTSGEYRISNYLLWESAYSEFVFTDVLWPDFRREHLFDAVARVPAPRPPLRRRRRHLNRPPSPRDSRDRSVVRDRHVGANVSGCRACTATRASSSGRSSSVRPTASSRS